MRSAIAVVTAALVAACGPEMDVAPRTPEVEEPGIARSDIVAGTTTTAWPAVGALVVPTGTPTWTMFCSGTLVDEEWVLTAAHCAQAFPFVYVSFFLGADTNGPGRAVQSDGFVVHPRWNSTTIGHDIALMHLKERVTDVTPIPVNTVALQAGVSLAMVGYGVSGQDASSEWTGGGVKRTGSVRVVRPTLGTYTYGRNEMGQIVCFGDSGGPDLVGGPGSERVAGVHSFGDGCQTLATATRADDNLAWIAETVASGVASECRLAGGDCGAFACYPSTLGNACVPSGYVQPYQPCESTAADPFPCADGTYCAATSDGSSVCWPLCEGGADCLGAEYCGTATEDGSIGFCVSHDGTCTPKTDAELCAGRGADCGPVRLTDDCGLDRAVTCGGCEAGKTCGGAGVPNVCAVPCTRLTCAAAGASCGTLADGCGGTLDCGLCGHLVISEVSTRGASGYDEFVELYNASGEAIDLAGYHLYYRSAASTAGGIDMKITFGATTVVPAGRHFLLGAVNSGGGYVGLVDATFASNGLADAGGSVWLSSAKMASVSAGDPALVDLLGWGSAVAGNFEGSGAATSQSAGNQSIERAAPERDTDDNLADFVRREARTPQGLE